MDGQAFRVLCSIVAPEVGRWLSHDSEVSQSTWFGELKNGKAVEFTTLCAIIAYARERCKNLAFDSLLEQYPEFMYLRNQIPLTHGAKAGHSASDDFPIKDRYLAAFTPKARFSKGTQEFNVFREGLPHLELLAFIEGQEINRSRADLLVVPGEFVSRLDGDVMHIEWHLGTFSFVCDLRAIDGITPRIIDYKKAGEVPQLGALVECSVYKTAGQLEEQISEYLKMFYVRDRGKIAYAHLGPSPRHNLGCDFKLEALRDSDAPHSSGAMKTFFAWLDLALT